MSEHKTSYLRPEQCSICHRPIDVGPGGWTGGHNASPVNDGRCCTDCNQLVVIPARIELMFKKKSPEATAAEGEQSTQAEEKK